ncbi:MAG: hypothetical protein ABWY02_15795 [Telluria sp.]
MLASELAQGMDERIRRAKPGALRRRGFGDTVDREHLLDLHEGRAGRQPREQFRVFEHA